MLSSRCAEIQPIQRRMGNPWSSQALSQRQGVKSMDEVDTNIDSGQDNTRSLVELNTPPSASQEEERLKWKKETEDTRKQLLEETKLNEKYKVRIKQLESEAAQRTQDEIKELMKQRGFMNENLLGENLCSHEGATLVQPLSTEYFEKAMKSYMCSQQEMLNHIKMEIQQTLKEHYESHQRKLDEVMAKNAEMVKEVKRLEKENTDCKNSLMEREKSMRTLEERARQLQAANTDLHQENDSLKSPQCPRVDCQGVKESVTNMQKKLEACNRNVTAMGKEMESLKKGKCQLEDGMNQQKKDIAHLQKELHKRKNDCERLHQENDYLKRSPECPKGSCVDMRRRITYLEEQLTKKTSQFEKLSVMKQLQKQQSTAHDQLKTEYEELWDPDVILETLEEHLQDPFDAKRLLTEMFMNAYEESKQFLMDYLMCNISDNLYKLCLTMDENNIARLDSLSRAFGLLLHSSGAKDKHTEERAVADVCKKVEKRTQNSKVLEAPINCADLPLDRIVEIAWKCVTQACPVIVHMPPKFDAEIHEKSYTHWDESCDDRTKPLIYAKPVLFRSYHCVKLKSGLVGNTLERRPDLN